MLECPVKQTEKLYSVKLSSECSLNKPANLYASLQKTRATRLLQLCLYEEKTWRDCCKLYIHWTKRQARQRLRLVADTASTLQLGMQHRCMDPNDMQPAGSSRSWTADVHTMQQQRSALGCFTQAAAGSGDWSMQVAQ